MRKSVIDLINRYFAAFENANHEDLKKLLSKHVVLQDWAIRKEGREDVIDAMVSFVKSFNSVKVNIQKIFIDEENMVATAMIQIVVSRENSETLEVVDIIDYFQMGENCHISSITAYKQ